MAPRAYWKGSLKLSLVTCPVQLYPASTATAKTRFHMINRETGNRLKQQMIDAETGKIVEDGQKARGYELKKGEYVEVETEELKAVQIESTHTIEIDSFVPRDEIDKRYLDHPYYIVPDGKAGIDAFAVIRDAMKDQGPRRDGPHRPDQPRARHHHRTVGKGSARHDLALSLRIARRGDVLQRYPESENIKGHG